MAEQPEPFKAWIIRDRYRYAMLYTSDSILIGTADDATRARNAKGDEHSFAVLGPYDFTIAIKP